MVAFSLSSVAKANKQKASAKGIKTSRVKKGHNQPCFQVSSLGNFCPSWGGLWFLFLVNCYFHLPNIFFITIQAEKTICFIYLERCYINKIYLLYLLTKHNYIQRG